MEVCTPCRGMMPNTEQNTCAPKKDYPEALLTEKGNVHIPQVSTPHTTVLNQPAVCATCSKYALNSLTFLVAGSKTSSNSKVAGMTNKELWNVIVLVECRLGVDFSCGQEPCDPAHL